MKPCFHLPSARQVTLTRFLEAMILSTLLTAFIPAQALASTSQPNIVVIMSDNQGYGDLGAYGGLRAPTPRLDAFAREGIQFMDFQVEPGCTPTRAAFMTGRMPIRSGTSGYVEPGQPGGLDPREITLAELLKGAGYNTAMYGKWHLGETHERQPHMQGFDEWYGVTNTTVPIDPAFPGIDTSKMVSQKILSAKVGQKARIVGEMSLEKRSPIDRELVEKSVAYIDEHADDDQPFFLFLALTNPHHPVVPHPDFRGKSKGGAYTDVLMKIDHHAGMVMNAIETAGIADDTIFIFFSDNGPTRYSPEPDHNGDNGPWSGELGSAWEGGLRTIGMIRWPGKIAPGQRSMEMFHVMDFYNTLGALAGADLPADRPLDGVDQSDYLLGKQAHSNRDLRLVYYYDKLTAVRWQQYKFHFITYARTRSSTRPSVDLAQIPEIYNLYMDPKEMYNLFGASGGIALFQPMMQAITPVLRSFAKYPNGDYSMMRPGN